jgi:hypothetical protein
MIVVRYTPRPMSTSTPSTLQGLARRGGIQLAKLEMQGVLRAMVEPVQTIEVGSPTRLRNNTLQGIAQLPAHLIPVQ